MDIYRIMEIIFETLEGENSMSLINFIDDYIDYYGLTREDPTYHYNGVPVPRTTDIISSMLHEQGLMEWSNRLGKYQKKTITNT